MIILCASEVNHTLSFTGFNSENDYLPLIRLPQTFVITVKMKLRDDGGGHFGK